MRRLMRMGVRVPVNMTLPKDLVDKLDEIAGPRNRSAFVEDSVRYRLRREEMRLAWQSVAGSLRPADYPEWATTEKVQGWVRERRREQTRSTD